MGNPYFTFLPWEVTTGFDKTHLHIYVKVEPINWRDAPQSYLFSIYVKITFRKSKG
jgi:hypothetical protein